MTERPSPLRSVLVVAAIGTLLATSCVRIVRADGSATSTTSSEATNRADDTTTSRPSNTQPDRPLTTSPDGALTQSPVDWRGCEVELECGTISVPLDYAEPGGARISLALARRPATGSPNDRIGSLLVNPGGPGGSGIGYLRNGAFPDELLERFDLVGFDPRGVGESAAIDCVDDFDDTEFVTDGPDDEASWNEVLDLQRTFVQDCVGRSGPLLSHVGTNDAARDMDQIRLAVGDDKLSFIGLSYGTRLGATYAELFPQNVRALVLDGAVKPVRSEELITEEQIEGFERAWANFVEACDDDRDCLLNEIGGAERTFKSVEKQITEDGSMSIDGSDRILTVGEFYIGVLASLYAVEAWPYLDFALHAAQTSGDGEVLQLLADSLVGRQQDGTYDNSGEAFMAVTCTDDPERPTPERRRELSRAAFGISEHFGPALSTDTGCLYWPASNDPLALGPAAGAAPILVIGTTGDPATPYEWSVELAAFLESGHLFSYDGEGHTAFGQANCVDEVIIAYLVDLELPPTDAACAAPRGAVDYFP